MPQKSTRPAAKLTPSEKAFFAALKSLKGASGLALRAPQAELGAPEPAAPEHDFLEHLFAHRDEYLVRDRYATIGEASEFFTKVAGVSFEGRQDLLAGLREGDSLALERQPENPHDANAIAVRMGTLQIGFLNKSIARRLAPKIDDGARYRAEVASLTGGGKRSRGVNIFVRREREIVPARNAASARGAGREQVQLALIGERAMRDSQREVLARLEQGYNTLAVMGTGRGKSFCYQYPAAVNAFERGQKTLVVYPLRALANDQFEAMRRRLEPLGLRLFRANGAIGDEERASLMSALSDGSWDVICSTPEFVQYHRERFAAEQNRPALLVADEAHHFFESKHRAAYAELGRSLQSLGNPQVLALTATAREETFTHLREVLGIEAWVIDATIRANLRVVDARGTRDRVAYIKDVLRGAGKAIVYCNSRSVVTKTAEALRGTLGGVAFYHAGVPNAERTAVEGLFRDGALRVVAATSAFGEGIDLPDVRHVFLFHLNFSFTEFNQQAGRAGRDGGDASIHLLYGERDRNLNDFIIARSAPTLSTLRELYRGLRGLTQSGELRMNNSDIAATLAMEQVEQETVSVALRIFEDAGLVGITRDDDGRLVTFREQREKIDLTKNERFAEGEAERESFSAFCNFALEAKPEVLEGVVNRPIYPDRAALLEPGRLGKSRS